MLSAPLLTLMPKRKFFSELKDAGLLDVKRGRGGGYWLTKAGKARARHLIKC